MKKYKVLKTIFDTKKGEILETDFGGDVYFRKTSTLGSSEVYVDPLAYPKYFEEIDGRWKPKVGERYFYIVGLESGVDSMTWDGYPAEKDLFDSFNVFKTKKDAEKALEKVLEKVKETLRQFHEDN